MNFPSNPSVNDTYSFNGKTWTWNGSGWQLNSTVGQSLTLSGNVTANAFIGDGSQLTGLPTGRVPVGTINERPLVPQHGMIRYNTDLNEVEIYTADGWQVITSGNLKLKLDFDEYQFDGRISFTRATNGTYFDSAGVLRTVGSGVARFNHRLENGSWVNKGLLIEEQRTNLQTYSEDFSQASGLTNVTVTTNTNDTTAPDGTNTADIIVENTTNGGHFLITPAISVAASTKYTLSVFAKKGTRDFVRLNPTGVSNWPSGQGTVYFNLANGTVGTNLSPSDAVPSIQDVGNGWYRCSVSISSLSGATGTFGLAILAANADNQATYAGLTGGKAVYVWGAQIEVGAFPTSYIKTTNASTTRNADVATMTGTNFSSWYNATEGTVFCQFSFNGLTLPGGNAQVVWNISDGTANERMQINTFTDDPVNLSYFVFRDGGTLFDISSPDPRKQAFINTTYKSCSAYKLNNNATSLDGVAPTTLNTVTMPTVNRLNIGSNQVDAGQTNMHIAKFYYWNTRRPNEVLQNLTE